MRKFLPHIKKPYQTIKNKKTPVKSITGVF